MKAQDLRIGNYLQAPLGEIMRVAQLGHEQNPDFIFCKGDDGSFGQNGFEPIPLTEEWLVGFGFKPDFNGKDFWYHGRIRPFSVTREHIYLPSGFYDCSAPCQFVHQVQNIFFALTGEELTTTPIQ